MNLDILDSVRFDEAGLVPCVAQDAESGEVLMVAYMNRASLQETLEKGLAAYWSRTRKRHWVKGETSGHTQEVREARFDCDRDCVLIRVRQNGGAACHTGMRSCFSWKWTPEGIVEDGHKVFDPDRVYPAKP